MFSCSRSHSRCLFLHFILFPKCTPLKAMLDIWSKHSKESKRSFRVSAKSCIHLWGSTRWRSKHSKQNCYFKKEKPKEKCQPHCITIWYKQRRHKSHFCIGFRIYCHLFGSEHTNRSTFFFIFMWLNLRFFFSFYFFSNPYSSSWAQSL